MRRVSSYLKMRVLGAIDVSLGIACDINSAANMSEATPSNGEDCDRCCRLTIANTSLDGDPSTTGLRSTTLEPRQPALERSVDILTLQSSAHSSMSATTLRNQSQIERYEATTSYPSGVQPCTTMTAG